MRSNQRKVSVISTHMPVSGWGIFNKRIQMCLCLLYVIWMCVCVSVQLEKKSVDWLWLDSASQKRYTHMHSLHAGLFLATVALFAQPLCSVSLTQNPPPPYSQGEGQRFIRLSS